MFVTGAHSSAKVSRFVGKDYGLEGAKDIRSWGGVFGEFVIGVALSDTENLIT